MDKKASTQPKRKNRLLKTLHAHYGTLLGLLVLCVIIALSSKNFLTIGNLVNVLRQISINGILAVGITFVILLGGVDLSISSTCAAGGCLVVMLLNYDWPIWLAVTVSLLFGVAVGLFNGICVAYTKLPYFILTLSTQSVVRGLAYIFTKGFPLVSSNPSFNTFGNGEFKLVLGSLTLPVPYSVILMVGIFVVSGVVLSRTRFGRHLYATGGNEEAAIHSGIKVKRIQIITFVISGFLASLAGIVLASKMNTGQPTAATGYEGEAIAAAVLGGISFSGGIGTIGCTVIGSIIIGVLGNGMNMMHIDSFYQMVVKGLVILGAVYFDSVKGDLFRKKRPKQPTPAAK